MAAVCGRFLEPAVVRGLAQASAARPGARCRYFSSSALLRANSGEPPKFQPPPKPVIIDKSKVVVERRFLSPEFIPRRGRKDPLKYYIERIDMIRRRKVLNIPEFYVGSILSVTTADPYASDKTSRFVGICIQRGGKGLGGKAQFVTITPVSLSLAGSGATSILGVGSERGGEGGKARKDPRRERGGEKITTFIGFLFLKHILAGFCFLRFL